MRNGLIGRLTSGLVCGVLIAAGVVGCGGGGNSGGNNPPVATLKITTASPLTPGTVGTAYTATLAASGGTAPYTWSVSTGTLPAGLTLSSGGVLSGTPSAAGTATFTVSVKDSEATPQTATLAASLVISTAVVPLAITTTSPLPGGTLGTAYVANFAASGGTAPYTWTISSGSLPAGLTLSSAGLLSGTPTASGAFSFTVQVTDSAATSQTVSGAFTLQISVGTITIATSSLPAGSVGSAYSAQLAATGGVAPYTWTLASGSALPSGLTLSASGLISGTPGTPGSGSPSFIVTDSTGAASAAKALPITINPGGGTVPDNFYSFVFAGTAPQGTPVTPNGIAINGRVQIKGGQVVGGFYDENFNTNAPVLEAAISGGSLTLGPNGLGQLVITTATSTLTFALASPASVSAGGLTPIRMIEYDDATGNGSRGSGVIDPTPATPTTTGISGNFSFLLSGTDIDQNEQALAGSFRTDGAGNITGGAADANQVVPVNGVPTRQVASFTSLTGTYSVDTNGRGLLKLQLGGSTTYTYSFYEVSPAEWLVISLDPATLNSPLVSGFVYQQAAGPFSNASLPGTSVLELSGVSQPPGGTAIPDITLGLATSNGSGTLNFTFDEYAGKLTTGGTLAVTYTVDPTTGRAVSSGSTAQPILYVIDSTSAFVLGNDASGSSGMLEAQTGTPFSIASFNGSYLGGGLPLVLTSVLNESGLITADGAGNVSFTTNRSSSAGLAYQSGTVIGTYTVDSTGRGVITAADGTTRIFYVVSPTKIAFLSGDTNGYLGTFQQ